MSNQTFIAHLYIGRSNAPLCIVDHPVDTGTGEVVAKCGKVGRRTARDAFRNLTATCPGCLNVNNEGVRKGANVVEVSK